MKNLKALRPVRTGISSQVRSDNPAGLVEASQIIGDRNQRSAHNGDLEIDQVKADEQTGRRDSRSANLLRVA